TKRSVPSISRPQSAAARPRARAIANVIPFFGIQDRNRVIPGAPESWANRRELKSIRVRHDRKRHEGAHPAGWLKPSGVNGKKDGARRHRVRRPQVKPGSENAAGKRDWTAATGRS